LCALHVHVRTATAAAAQEMSKGQLPCTCLVPHKRMLHLRGLNTRAFISMAPNIQVHIHTQRRIPTRLRSQAKRVGDRLADKKMRLELTDPALDHLARVSYDPVYGARYVCTCLCVWVCACVYVHMCVSALMCAALDITWRTKAVIQRKACAAVPSSMVGVGAGRAVRACFAATVVYHIPYMTCAMPVGDCGVLLAILVLRRLCFLLPWIIDTAFALPR